MPRRVVVCALGLTLALSIVAASLVSGQPTSRRIEIAARKFSFDSTEVHLRKGERVTFALTSVDFAHGFAIPELGVRVDLVPGKTTHFEVTPRQAGRFTFLCDNFCGEGHDNMHGTLVVSE
jgi:cytochrome c oxidase subunit 2